MLNALAIVAHPDDEIIWMGGTIIRNKDWDWTIVSLSRKNDNQRAPLFRKVCNSLKAKCKISDLEDEELKPLSLEIIEDKILSLLDRKEYDYIFTHGENGEYGHIRHREIHRAVKKLIKEKKLECKKIFYFAYTNKDGECLAKERADKYINLSDIEFSYKKMLLMKIYGFKKESFEEKACSGIEAFTIF